MKKVSSWRPEDWKNPFLQQDKDGNYIDSRVYEAGADAMLVALRSGGWRVKGESIIPAYGEYPEIHLEEKLHGWLVFIPEEVEK